MAGKDDSAQDDSALFRQAMGGVNRNHRNYRQERHIPDTPPLPPTPAIKRRQPRLSEAVNPTGVMVDEAGTGRGGYVEFARGGLQRSVLRKLKRGDYRITATLDLHGHTTPEAEAHLHRFITNARAAGDSTISIIHGKGLRSGETGGVLKPFTLGWLKQQPTVQAFCSALPKHGGTGAVYVLLRTARDGGRRPLRHSRTIEK